MSDNFKSFTELANYLNEPIKELEWKTAKVLVWVWSYLQKQVKSKYWVAQPWWARSTTNPSTPLVDTWELKESIQYNLIWSNSVVIAPVGILEHKSWKSIPASDLAMIHEYWTIHIPARPLWRTILEEEDKKIEELVDSMIGIF